MENSTDKEKDPTTSMRSSPLARVQFESTPVMADIIVYSCANSYCPCRTVTLDFFSANDRLDDRLFRIIINYETWRIESASAFNDDLDCLKIADEFMNALDDNLKADILCRIVPKAQKEHALRDDIKSSDGKLVYYQEIYRTEPYEDLLFELDGKEYLVLDHYCPRPGCNCNDVVLSFYLVDSDTIEGEPVLSYRVKFDTGRGIVEDKGAGVSFRFVKDLYGMLSEKLGGSAVSFFENRYRKIKEWGATLTGVKDIQVKTVTEKTGRNDPCPCGSGKKYKKCCGLQATSHTPGEK